MTFDCVIMDIWLSDVTPLTNLLRGAKRALDTFALIPINWLELRHTLAILIKQTCDTAVIQ